MTRTRWLLACAAVLLCGTAQAQEPDPSRDCRTPSHYTQPFSYRCPSPETACPAQAAETVRAPYYYELPHLLYPVKAPALAPISNPVVWARLFEAVASNHAACQAGACESSDARARARRESYKRRMGSELLKLYRVFYREGHYRAAEIVANKALELDPANVAAEHALTVARLTNAAVAHDRCSRDGAEECDVNNAAPRPSCGMCRSVQDEVKKACRAQPSSAKCACEGECDCCKDPSSCSCGDKCPCKKPAPQRRVSRVRNLMVPNLVPYFVPGPNGEAIAVPMPCCPPPANVMAAPVPNVMHACPCMPSGCCMGAPVGVRIVAPEPVPMPALNPPLPNVMMTSTIQPSHKHPSIRIDVRNNQVHVTAPSLDACADSVRSTADGRAVFKGHASVSFRGENLPARILADCIVVNLEDGSYEVITWQVGSQWLRMTGAKKCSKSTSLLQPSSCVCPKPCDDPLPEPSWDDK